MITRRDLLRGATAGSLMLSPLGRSLAARATGAEPPPRRFVFVLFENGLRDFEVQPAGVPLGGEKTRAVSLADLTLPKRVIEPFAPFKDRLTLIQGLSGKHLNPNHGAGYGALSGVPQAPADKRRVRAESIDAALAKLCPGLFPMVCLGIHGGAPETSTAYGISAWDRGKPVPIQCRPELAYESLFGSAGTSQNDFLSRKNLLDFVSGDLQHLQGGLGSAEREQLDYHLEALESLSKRWGRLGAMKEDGKLARHAPKLPTPPPQTMPDVIAAQFDLATAALTAGLTNVVTITSGLGGLSPSYLGFSNMGQHSAGHNNPDNDLNVKGNEIVRRAHHFMAQRTADLVKKLQSIPEGDGTMLDHTLIVFLSDSANRQHCDGLSWPVVLIGSLGGKLKTGRLINYPMEARMNADYGGEMGKCHPDNPTLNRLYCTLLHAAGAPREQFNLTVAGLDRTGPLPELLA